MNTKIKEDIYDIGQGPSEVSDEDINTAKKNTIKYMLGSENLNLDNLNDEELDQLLGRSQTMQEKINDLLECMDAVNANDLDKREALKVNLGFKLEEAEEILKEHKLNG